MDMTTQLIPPATRRRQVLQIINTNVDSCNDITTIRLDNCRLYKDASLADVLVYLRGERNVLADRSQQIQKAFGQQIRSLM